MFETPPNSAESTMNSTGLESLDDTDLDNISKWLDDQFPIQPASEQLQTQNSTSDQPSDQSSDILPDDDTTLFMSNNEMIKDKSTACVINASAPPKPQPSVLYQNSTIQLIENPQSPTQPNVNSSNEGTSLNQFTPLGNATQTQEVTSQKYPRNSRKSRITIRHAPESSSMEEVSVSPNIPRVAAPAAQAQEELHCGNESPSKRRNTLSDSTAAGASKKLKKYEMDGPDCKHAKNARATRIRTKNEKEELKREISELRASNKAKDEVITELTSREQVLQIRVDQMDRKYRAVVGLKRVLTPSKEIIGLVMYQLVAAFGGEWKLEVAPWFSKVDSPGVEVTEVTEDSEMSPTSNYVTMYIDTANKVLKVDYMPDEPILSENVPQ